jgi:hypothetical protein
MALTFSLSLASMYWFGRPLDPVEETFGKIGMGVLAIMIISYICIVGYIMTTFWPRNCCTSSEVKVSRVMNGVDEYIDIDY